MKLTKRFFEENFIGIDRAIKSENTFKFRKYFYYRHGKDEYLYTEQLVKQFEKHNLNFTIIKRFEKWQQWPKDSYWEIQVKFD